VSKPDKFLHGHLNPLKLDGEQKEHNEKFRLSMGNSLSKQRFAFTYLRTTRDKTLANFVVLILQDAFVQKS
jgi:hypothetical protein